MEAATAVPEVQLIDISEIVESQLNPRKTYESAAIDELAESIRLVGVQQPIRVRQKMGLFEIVFGHRRFRAAKMAGLTTIPSIVGELPDDQVLALQLHENGKRSDFSPVEEAQGYETLRTEFGKTVAEIAGQVGKSEAYVYQRLALLRLPQAAAEALSARRMPLRVALAIASIHDEHLRSEATTEILTERLRADYDPKTHEELQVKTAMGQKAALELIRRRYSLRLQGCDWDLADAELLPKAGACHACPKRSVNQPALFADLADTDDRCLDPDCFEAKQLMAWNVRKAAEEAKGRKVLEGRAAEEVVGEFGQLKPGYLKPESRVSTDPKNRTVAQILGSAALEKATVLARAKDGQTYEAVPAAEVNKAVKAAVKAAGLPDEKEQKAKAKEADKAERAENERKARIDELTASFSVEMLVMDFQHGGGAERWATIGSLMLDHAERTGDASYLEVALRRGMVELPTGATKTKGTGEAFEAAALKELRSDLECAKDSQAAALVFELLLAQAGCFETWGGDGQKLLKSLAKDWEIDLSKAKERAKETVKGEQPKKLTDRCAREKERYEKRAWRPGDRVLFRQGKGSFEAFVIRIEGDQAHCERVSDGRKVVRAVDALEPAPSEAR